MSPANMHGRPTVEELLDAVRAFLPDLMAEQGPEQVTDSGSESRSDSESASGPSRLSDASARHQIRIALHALEIVGRELALGPAQDEAHRARLTELGFQDDAALADAIRSGRLADGAALRRVLREDTRDRLLVANPRWLPADPV